MTEASPDLQELVRRALDSRLRGVNVAMPGIVQSYNAAKKTATVLPAIRSTVPDDDGIFQPEDLPPIDNVKVIWPRCGKLSITGTLQAGDSVELVFQTRAVTEWRSTGRVSTPVDERYHGLGYPVAFPGYDSDVADEQDTDDSIGRPGGLRLHFTDAAVSAGTGTVFVGSAMKIDAAWQALFSAMAALPPAPLTGSALAAAFATLASAYQPSAVSNLKADA
jgi:hypothetical protein